MDVFKINGDDDDDDDDDVISKRFSKVHARGF